MSAEQKNKPIPTSAHAASALSSPKLPGTPNVGSVRLLQKENLERAISLGVSVKAIADPSEENNSVFASQGVGTMKTLETRLLTLDNRANSVEGKFSGIVKCIDDLSNRLKRLETMMERDISLGVSAKAIADQSEETNSACASQGVGAMKNFETKLLTLDNRANSVDGELSGMIKCFDDLSNRLERLETNMDNVNLMQVRLTHLFHELENKL